MQSQVDAKSSPLKQHQEACTSETRSAARQSCRPWPGASKICLRESGIMCATKCGRCSLKGWQAGYMHAWWPADGVPVNRQEGSSQIMFTKKSEWA